MEPDEASDSITDQAKNEQSNSDAQRASHETRRTFLSQKREKRQT